MKVIWGRYAKNSFIEEIDFILSKWNPNEVEKFILLVDNSVEKLASGAWQGKISRKNNFRSFVISKQTTLYFDVNENNYTIELLLFWNNQKNPKTLSRMLHKFL